MILAFRQQLDPLHDLLPWSVVWSTVLAALPVVVLFWLLVPRRWLAPALQRAEHLSLMRKMKKREKTRRTRHLVSCSNNSRLR